MLRQEVVLIDEPATPALVRVALESLLPVTGTEVVGGVRFECGGVTVGVFPNDYVDEPGLALSDYAVVIDIEGEQRVAVARQIFTHFATLSHPLWMRDGGKVVAGQGVPA